MYDKERTEETEYKNNDIDANSPPIEKNPPFTNMYQKQKSYKNV